MKKLLAISLFFLCIACKKDTSSDKSSNTLQFLVLGDWGRNGTQNQQEVANQMNLTALSENTEFVISTGDNFYETGIQSTSDPQWKTSFEDVYAGKGLQKDWFVVLGNHDYQGNPGAQVLYSQKSTRWKMPARYFTVVKPIDGTTAVRFVFIDSNPFVNEYLQKSSLYADILQQNTKKQLAWIDSVLTNSKEKWKIVVGHHPIYSGGYGHGNQDELIAQLKPILEKNHVQMYFCGHSHSSQYLKVPGSLVDYVVAGAGSSTQEFVQPQTSVLFGTIAPSFTLVSISSDSLKTSFIDTTGHVLFKNRRSY
ncbi:acid phosphatase [Pseudarcicella hirudinis]|uniref:acid phosphatase n=1 Tax=Pseudarcicella hirudinis TaxID=1079859 RepID=A0A1I5UPY8_9BACT|nr:tartrate-resistant acid phosphatase type 5 family protein [Pseudarcicella hirudinis]SFP97321.1 acid phosphatase [Pseudarcicella hirudinis]